MNIAIIPARGGSKRLLRKNIRDFGGKPMINWTIEAAIYSSVFDKIIVSTEDWEIAGIAEECGAEVVIRDEILADDYTPSSLVTVDIVSKLGGDIICQLLPTCPLRTGTDVIDAYKAFKKSGAPSQISITDFGWQTPRWEVNENGMSKYPFGRSQDLETCYHPTGAVWFAQSTPLMLNKSFYMTGQTGWFLHWMRAIDIDTQEDMEIADAIRRVG